MPDASPPVFLVGMMGAGKSTIGARLAARLGRRFVDLDAEVEREVGTTVQAVFTERGEPAFRALEGKVLRTAELDGAVVATGGGLLIDPMNAAFVLSRGAVVYLRAQAATLAARIVGDARPLLAGTRAGSSDRTARLEELLRARGASYERAHFTIDTDFLDVEQVVDEIAVNLAASKTRVLT